MSNNLSQSRNATNNKEESKMLTYDSSKFIFAVYLLFAEQWLKLMSHHNDNNDIPKWRTEKESSQQIIDVFNRTSYIQSNIDNAYTIIKQIEQPPPIEWLEQFDLTVMCYRQRHIDWFTTTVHTTLDLVLLLINNVYILRIPEKKCRIKKIEKIISKPYPNLRDKLSILVNAISDISEDRHNIIHRGDHRKISPFYSTYYAYTATKAWNPDYLDEVDFCEDESLDKVISILNANIDKIRGAVIEVLNELTNPYLAKIKELGGPNVPTEEERPKAIAVIEYFSGGPKPEFLK